MYTYSCRKGKDAPIVSAHPKVGKRMPFRNSFSEGKNKQINKIERIKEQPFNHSSFSSKTHLSRSLKNLSKNPCFDDPSSEASQMSLPTTKPFWLLSLSLLFFLAESGSDYSTLVYNGCAKQDLSDPGGAYSQAISALFGSLISQSSKSKFFKTTTGSAQTTVTGLFQCRGDLSNVDCYSCVSNLPVLIDKLCGQEKVAARIQLMGCYMLYEVAGFSQVSGMEMLYKSCSGKNSGGGSEFEERRDTALSQLENGIGSGNGFYTTSYDSVYVLGQCEGDLGSADCGDCVKSAVQRSQVECGSSVSGQVYLNKCFISYSYYPNGVPKRSASASESLSSSSGTEQNTRKTVAIILGGAVGIGFVVICLLFARNLTKKRDDF